VFCFTVLRFTLEKLVLVATEKFHVKYKARRPMFDQSIRRQILRDNVCFLLSSKSKIINVFDHFEEAATVACTLQRNFGYNLHQDIQKPRKNLVIARRSQDLPDVR